jgi:hypothetical protein
MRAAGIPRYPVNGTAQTVTEVALPQAGDALGHVVDHDDR